MKIVFDPIDLGLTIKHGRGAGSETLEAEVSEAVKTIEALRSAANMLEAWLMKVNP